MNLLWAPGQSDAAREICRDLNRREKASLYGLSFLFGLCSFAALIVLVGAVMGLGPFQERLEGFAFPLLAGLAAALWAIVVLQRRLLLGTTVAKSKGFTAADLKRQHPWSHRDYLVLGAFAGLVLVVALAGIGIASL